MLLDRAGDLMSMNIKLQYAMAFGSADLNPAQHLWEILGRHISAHFHLKTQYLLE